MSIFPPKVSRNATSDQIGLLKDKIKDEVAGGSSTLAGALQLALARKPASIVLVTAKTKLQEDDATDFKNALDKAGGKTRLYVIAIGSSGGNEYLKALAKESGGQYRLLSVKDLRNVLN